MALDDVADELSISRFQPYALVRNGTLPAAKLGGRGQWRVERTGLEARIEQAHADTSRFIADHPFTGLADDDLEMPPEGGAPGGQAMSKPSSGR